MNKVAVIMGSKSDLSVMEGAINILKDFDVSVEVKIVSAHRTPEMMLDFASTASSKGIKVIIAGAGGAADLPGMVASLTSLPVIGVPVSITELKGMDSLLSIVQMPAGVPVATVGINNSKNAGLLALRILGLEDKKISQKLNEYRENEKQKVMSAQI